MEATAKFNAREEEKRKEMKLTQKEKEAQKEKEKQKVIMYKNLAEDENHHDTALDESSLLSGRPEELKSSIQSLLVPKTPNTVQSNRTMQSLLQNHQSIYEYPHAGTPEASTTLKPPGSCSSAARLITANTKPPTLLAASSPSKPAIGKFLGKRSVLTEKASVPQVESSRSSPKIAQNDESDESDAENQNEQSPSVWCPPETPKTYFWRMITTMEDSQTGVEEKTELQDKIILSISEDRESMQWIFALIGASAILFTGKSPDEESKKSLRDGKIVKFRSSNNHYQCVVKKLETMAACFHEGIKSYENLLKMFSYNGFSLILDTVSELLDSAVYIGEENIGISTFKTNVTPQNILCEIFSAVATEFERLMLQYKIPEKRISSWKKEQANTVSLIMQVRYFEIHSLNPSNEAVKQQQRINSVIKWYEAVNHYHARKIDDLKKSAIARLERKPCGKEPSVGMGARQSTDSKQNRKRSLNMQANLTTQDELFPAYACVHASIPEPSYKQKKRVKEQRYSDDDDDDSSLSKENGDKNLKDFAILKHSANHRKRLAEETVEMRKEAEIFAECIGKKTERKKWNASNAKARSKSVDAPRCKREAIEILPRSSSLSNVNEINKYAAKKMKKTLEKFSTVFKKFDRKEYEYKMAQLEKEVLDPINTFEGIRDLQDVDRYKIMVSMLECGEAVEVDSEVANNENTFAMIMALTKQNAFHHYRGEVADESDTIVSGSSMSIVMNEYYRFEEYKKEKLIDAKDMIKDVLEEFKINENEPYALLIRSYVQIFNFKICLLEYLINLISKHVFNPYSIYCAETTQNISFIRDHLTRSKSLVPIVMNALFDTKHLKHEIGALSDILEHLPLDDLECALESLSLCAIERTCAPQTADKWLDEFPWINSADKHRKTFDILHKHFGIRFHIDQMIPDNFDEHKFLQEAENKYFLIENIKDQCTQIVHNYQNPVQVILAVLFSQNQYFYQRLRDFMPNGKFDPMMQTYYQHQSFLTRE